MNWRQGNAPLLQGTLKVVFVRRGSNGPMVEILGKTREEEVMEVKEGIADETMEGVLEQKGDGERRLLRCDHKVTSKHESEAELLKVGETYPPESEKHKLNFSFALKFTLKLHTFTFIIQG